MTLTPFLGVEADVLLIAGGLSLIAGLLSGMSGFGAGLVLSAYLTPVLGVKTAVPVLTIAMLITNVGRLGAYRHEFAGRVGALVLIGALPMTVIGSVVFAIISPRALELLLGTFLIAIVPLRRWLKRHAWQLGPKGLFVGSMGFGLATGTTPGTGVLLISLLLSADLSGPALIGTDAVVAIGTNIAKALTFGRFALLDTAGMLLGCLIGILTIPGSYVAAWVVRRTSVSLHVIALELLVAVGGVHLVYRSAAG